MFIVGYNEAVMILFPRGGANTDGGPIIPVIILIGAFNEHDNYFSRNSTYGKKRERDARRAISTLFRQC